MSYLGNRYRTRLGASTSSGITQQKNEGGIFWDLFIYFLHYFNQLPSPPFPPPPPRPHPMISFISLPLSVHSIPLYLYYPLLLLILLKSLSLTLSLALSALFRFLILPALLPVKTEHDLMLPRAKYSFKAKSIKPSGLVFLNIFR